MATNEKPTVNVETMQYFPIFISKDDAEGFMKIGILQEVENINSASLCFVKLHDTILYLNNRIGGLELEVAKLRGVVN